MWETYGNITKLRRHDWRSHREVDCSICGEKLQSRQQISEHRRSQHQINKIAICKFYPGCLDDYECFFKHVEKNTNENASVRNRFFCKDGERCSDQSCVVSEANHVKSRNILCRFQVNCNRLNCSFKHTCERKAFLGEGSLNSKDK